MFLKALLNFQDEHVNNLLEKYADYNDIVLFAPTGSGKTIMASKFIDDYLDENPKVVFLWLCPGEGGLEKQSKNNVAESTSGISYGDVYDFIQESNPVGKVYLVNWDKINKSSNVVLREGEHKDLMSRVKHCHSNNIKIFMIIDEEHKSKDTANEYISNIQPDKILRISATPDSQVDYKEEITENEVIAEGLIATSISINEGVSKAIEENNNLDDDLLLIELANEKRKQIQAEYDKLGEKIRPLVVIQFPNGNDEWIKRVKNKLASIDGGYTENSGLVTSWFSGDHPDNPEEIKKLDGQYSFLLFKQAIATGWDCPRAKILVKLREGGTEKFNIQTIGRIRRMPKRHHYENEILDNCYLYTLDSEFTEGLTSGVNASFYTYLYKRKSTAPNILLKKEYINSNDTYAINQEEVVRVIKKQFIQECDIDHNRILEKREMETSKGYIFGTILKTSAFEGVARTAHDMMSLNSIFGGEHEINIHDDGFIIRDAKRKIAKALNIDEHISNNVLRILFGPTETQMSLLSQEEIDFEKENKLIEGMSLKEFNAFLVNNRELLVETFSKISVEEISAHVPEIKTKNWGIPPAQYYKQHKKIDADEIMEKNVFVNYGDNILIQPNRTYSEIKFENWCENKDSVKWCYKNGDKGDEYFSIIYKKAFRDNNFYPDYIIQLTNDDIWIIEAKGGMDADGKSNNIDKYAKNKFDALKEYCSRYPNIKFGFVRAVGEKTFISNTEWVEDVTNREHWKPIKDVIKIN